MIGWKQKFSDDYATAVINGEVDEDLDRMIETIEFRKRKLAAPADRDVLIAELEDAYDKLIFDSGENEAERAKAALNPEACALEGRIAGLKEARAWDNGEVPDYSQDPYWKDQEEIGS